MMVDIESTEWFDWGNGEGFIYDGRTYEAELGDGTVVLALATVYGSEDAWLDIVNENGVAVETLEELPKRIRWLGY